MLLNSYYINFNSFHFLMNQYKMKYIERNKNINRGFRKLVVYQETIELFNYVKIELDSLDKIS